MSMSVSPPSSVTNTSPWAIGFIVPASKLRYGSTFTQVTFREESWSNLASEDVVIPLPSPDITPPVTNTYLGRWDGPWGRASTILPSLPVLVISRRHQTSEQPR